MLIVCFMHAFCLVSFWKTRCACIMQPFLWFHLIFMPFVSILWFFVKYITQIVAHSSLAPFPTMCMLNCSPKIRLTLLRETLYSLFVLYMLVYIYSQQLVRFYSASKWLRVAVLHHCQVKSTSVPHCCNASFNSFHFDSLHWSIQSHELIVLHFFTNSIYIKQI